MNLRFRLLKESQKPWLGATRYSQAIGMNDYRGHNETDFTTQVVERVAEREGVDPTELRAPIDEVINPDALDSLFATRPDGQPRDGGRIRFTYLGYEVTIVSDGTISIEQLE